MVGAEQGCLWLLTWRCPLLQRAYMALNAQRAQDSCQGTGHTQGAPPMTVLVTGAGGFIGVHAALMVRRRGHGELCSWQSRLAANT